MISESNKEGAGYRQRMPKRLPCLSCRYAQPRTVFEWGYNNMVFFGITSGYK